MMLTREQVPDRVSDLLEGRPTHWIPGSRAVGDYDGRERTLEVFEADPREQLDLLRRLRELRPDIEQAIADLSSSCSTRLPRHSDSIQRYGESGTQRYGESGTACSQPASPSG
jgi:hypothetical protein